MNTSAQELRRPDSAQPMRRCRETAQARGPAIASLRLRLKPAHRTCGFVQGAWWPRSTLLADELPALLAAFELRFGPVYRVRYHEGDWSTAPQLIEHAQTTVALEPTQDSPHIITVFGTEFGRLTLLVVPPYTDPYDAYTAVTTAASVTDASTPEALLGLRELGAQDRHYAVALHRWESDGGAVCPTARAPMRDSVVAVASLDRGSA